MISLTVIDNEGADDITTTTVIINVPNNPPNSPTIDGETIGRQNIEYNYTIVSTDLDNDTIKYVFDWGDGETTNSSFLANNTQYNTTHIWTTAGIYLLKIYAMDENNATSDTEELTILIDLHYVKNIGYLIDNDSDGTFDAFYSNATGNEMDVEQQSNGKYLIDYNGNGVWDYVYNPETDELEEYYHDETSPLPLDAWTFILILIIIIIFEIIVFSWWIKKKNRQKSVKSAKSSKSGKTGKKTGKK